MATIHPRLVADCIPLGRFPLCHLLLMNDSNFPWFILVPDRDGIREIHELEERDRDRLLRESCVLAEYLMTAYHGDKLNIAALGNQVPQLHLHHIVRYESDPVWPYPVWGRHPPQAYSPTARREIGSAVTSAGLEGFESA